MDSPRPDATADTGTAAPNDPAEQDEFLWLEEIHSERALDWVREQNARTEALLESPELHAVEEQILAALDAPDRIAMVTKRGPHYYNFWRDAEHPRGLWRRTDWDSYLAGTPDWDVLLDLDALAATEQTPWVFAGAQLRRPAWDRALIRLSPDGGDAVRVREFNLTNRSFVPAAEGGFDLPAAKTQVSWLDADTLLVGTVTDTDPVRGDVTRSSYTRVQRLLPRGVEIAAAEQIFSVDRDHVAAFGYHDATPGWERTLAVDAVDFHRSVTWLRRDTTDPETAAVPAATATTELPGWLRIDVPEESSVSFHHEWISVYLTVDGTIRGVEHPAGSLLVAPAEAWLAGTAVLQPVLHPDQHTVLSSWTWTAHHLVLVLLENVSSTLRVLPLTRLGSPDAAAHAIELPLDPPNPADPFLTISAAAVDAEDPDCGDDLWVTATGALTPTTLLRLTLNPDHDGGTTASGTDLVLSRLEVVQAPERFDATGLTVTQHWADSADGTAVPYFQIGPGDLTPDGQTPVVMDGYGGFQSSKLPGYSAVQGLGWLTRRTAEGRQGAWVIANIRGGGEFGPSWHRAALRENRHRAYEDFAAVARDLVERGVTCRDHLAATGRSNGGLLMGNMAAQYPELFGALSCGVPLLDMRRYTVLSAGHSWIAEYGDPEIPEDWAFLRTFSPYHLLLDRPVQGAQQGRDGAGPGTGFPHQLVWTATSDDRVGPVQARKYAARLQRLGVPNTWYHEDLDGGHAGASDNRQAAEMNARSLHFLWSAVTSSGATL